MKSRAEYLVRARQEAREKIVDGKADIEKWIGLAEEAMFEGNEEFYYESLYEKCKILNLLEDRFTFLEKQLTELLR